MQTDFCCRPGRLMLRRRSALLGLGAAIAFGDRSLALASTPSDARLVVINLRGGLDGLAAVAPYGDANLARLRAPLMAPAVGQPGGMLYLGGYFGLHPSLTTLQQMFQAGEALFVHAVGNCGYTRSHFEGQDYLQGGAPEALASGWLNRAVSFLPASESGGVQTGIAINISTPLLMRGPSVVAGWAPDRFHQTSPTLTTMIMGLNQRDPLLGPALQVGYADRGLLAQDLAAGPTMPANLPPLAQLGWAAGELLASANGPRVAAMETNTFDTHADQLGRLNTGLTELDQTFAALKTTLGAAWSRTVVMTITEFGRTAAANTGVAGGTDHGTGFAVLMAGGALAGGRVIANWPGLGPSQLYQNRDLAPETDYRSIAMGVLQSHLGISPTAMSTIFPGATGVTAMSGLIRT